MDQQSIISLHGVFIMHFCILVLKENTVIALTFFKWYIKHFWHAQKSMNINKFAVAINLKKMQVNFDRLMEFYLYK